MRAPEMGDVRKQHRERIIEQFTLQAAPFSKLPGHSTSINILLEMSGVSRNDSVLDVACGPGLVACDFAPHARHITGIDITPGMIAHAKSRQREFGLENIHWAVGDAVPLPVRDSRFSVVLTRYSFHHFLDPAAVLAEMIRVCRPGGRVMVIDVVLPAEKADEYNRMEKLRDPSHVRALSSPEMAQLIADSGLRDVQSGWYRFEMELETLLAGSFPNPGDGDKIRQIFQEELLADRMGIGVQLKDGAIHYSVPILAIAGTKGSLGP